MIQTSELSRIDREHAKDRTKIIVKEYPCQASIVLSAPPSLLALSCDSLSLAVVVESEDLSQVYIYDTRSFVSQVNYIDIKSLFKLIGLIKENFSRESKYLFFSHGADVFLNC